MSQYDKYIQLLEANKNLIFTGAPGTGKTHLAKEIAREMTNKRSPDLLTITEKDVLAFFTIGTPVSLPSTKDELYVIGTSLKELSLNKEIPQIGKEDDSVKISLKEIVEAYNEKLWDKGKSKSLSTAKIVLAHYIYQERLKQSERQIQLVQFHPSYDYTDFVEGLRPVKHSENDTICFERRDGVFKRFCKEALENNLLEEPIGFNLYGEAYNEKIRTFFDTAIRERKMFYGKNKGENRAEFYIKAYTNEIIKVHNPNLKKDFELEYMVFYNFLKHDVNLKSVGEVDEYRQTLAPYARNGDFGTQLRTYVYSIYMELKKYMYPDGVVDPMIYSKSSSTLQNYVFIIDEINRGEVSKIFGELFSCIDPGYRGTKGKVTTQYTNLIEDDDVFKEGFYIPENVYIIATMNDIDRSVESMDFAFRRRFAWREIEVEDTLKEIVASLARTEWRKEAERRLTKLNEAITKDEMLGKAYHIGGSYLLKLNSIKETNQKEAFEQLWNYHIENVLREYLRGLPALEVTAKMDAFKQAYQ